MRRRHSLPLLSLLSLTVCAAALAVGGCRSSTEAHHDAVRVETAVNHKVSESLRRQHTASQTLVVEDRGFWVPLQPRPYNREEPLPPVFKKKVSLHVNDAGMDIVATLLRRMSGLPVTLRLAGARAPQQSAAANRADSSDAAGDGNFEAFLADERAANTPAANPDADDRDCLPVCVILRHNGTLRELLDALHTATGLSWRYHDGAIEIFRVQTRVFPLYGFLGTRSWSQDVSLEASSGGGGGGGEDNTVSNNNRVRYAGEEVNAATALRATLQTMLSPWGALTVSTIANNAVVTDTPETLSRIEHYINRLNKQLSRQALLRIAVYEVQNEASATDGLDVRGMIRRLSRGKNGLSLSLAGAAAAAGEGRENDRFIISYDQNTGGHEQQYQALVEALRSQDNVSLVTTSTLHVMHNMPTPLYIGEERTYLASTSNVVNGETSTSTQEPGVVRDGFSMNVVPSIIGGRIQLYYSININEVIDIVNFPRGSNNPTIQLPRIRNKTVVQQALLYSGDTLVLSGFTNTRGDTESSRGVAHYNGTSKGERTRTVILITPWLLDDGPAATAAALPGTGTGSGQ